MTDGPQATSDAAPPTGPAPTPAPSPLAAFLANRDCPCPHCRYNLRGATAPACPECGRPIELAIKTPARLNGYAALFAAALAWVMLASAMNAARQIYANYRTASIVSWQFGRAPTITSFTLARGAFTNRAADPAPISKPVDGSSGGAGGVMVLSDGGSTIVVPPGVTLALPNGGSMAGAAPAPPAPVPPSLNWSLVTPTEWFWTLWWTLLCLFAIAGLLRLALLLRTPGADPGASRLIACWAAALFCLYAGYHVTTFAGEVTRWF